MLLAVLMLFMMVTVPIVANPMEEEEEEEAVTIPCTWEDEFKVPCHGIVVQRCTGVHFNSYTRSCTKNYMNCTVIVSVYIHGGLCNVCMKSYDGSHDHTEYHTNPYCLSPQGVCRYY